MRRIALWSLAGMLAGFVICGILCEKCTTSRVVTVYDTLYVHDSVLIHVHDSVFTPYKEIDSVPYPVRIEVIKYDTIWRNLDTFGVVRDYYTKRYYTDTVRDDDIYINIQEQVYMNSIASRDVNYKILRPQEVHVSQSVKRNLLSTGAVVYGNGQGAGFAPMITYSNPRWTGGLGYDPFNKAFLIQSTFKIYEFK
jgi:hypothetical protein